MKRRRKLIWAVFLVLVAVPLAMAQTEEESKSFTLFQRTVAPTYLWGQDGVITIPQADNIGEYTLAASSNWMDAGQFRGEELWGVKYSFVLCPNDFMEFGYTRNELVFIESFERSPLHANIYNMKLKVLDLDRVYWPKLGIAVYGFSISNRDNFTADNVYLDIAPVITEDIPFDFLGGTNIGIHLGTDIGLLESTSTNPFFFCGLDFATWKERAMLLAEYVGANQKGENGVINLGVAFRLFKLAELGVAWYDVGGQAFDETEIMMHANLTVSFKHLWNKLVVERRPPSPDL